MRKRRLGDGNRTLTDAPDYASTNNVMQVTFSRDFDNSGEGSYLCAKGDV
jgi:hypothetical protein